MIRRYWRWLKNIYNDEQCWYVFNGHIRCRKYLRHPGKHSPPSWVQVDW